jgi:hypothetical protein
MIKHEVVKKGAGILGYRDMIICKCSWARGTSTAYRVNFRGEIGLLGFPNMRKCKEYIDMHLDKK